MSMAFALEFVLAIASGLAVARLWQGGMYFTMAGFGLTSCSFITGFSIAQAIGLWIEKARRRGPSPWGVGRVTLSILGLVCLVQWPWDTTWYVLRQYGDPTASPNPIWNLVRLTSAGSHYLAWVPLALLITMRLACLPGDPRPDAREWTGRAFGAMILLAYIFNDLYSLWIHGWDKVVVRH